VAVEVLVQMVKITKDRPHHLKVEMEVLELHHQ
jgi:hypothetical protein